MGLDRPFDARLRPMPREPWRGTARGARLVGLVEEARESAAHRARRRRRRRTMRPASSSAPTASGPPSRGWPGSSDRSDFHAASAWWRTTPATGARDHGEMHVGDGYYVGLAPLPDGQLNVGMALPMEGRGRAAARFAAAPSPGSRRRRTAGQDSRRAGPIRGASPIGHRVADVAGPGWLLVGDAAGFVDPFTGEGIHRALDRPGRRRGHSAPARSRTRLPQRATTRRSRRNPR